MSYTAFHSYDSNIPPPSSETILVDTDGAPLFETEYGGLKRKIIARNDVPRLKQYISAYSSASILAPGETYDQDPFFVAASHGSTNALRFLLEQCSKVSNNNSTNADLMQTTVPLDQRGFSLLNATCGSAQVETARFLLDSHCHPPSRTRTAGLSARHRWDETPLLSAAVSLACITFDDADESADRYAWICDRIARGEELMNFLLDRGASAQDAIYPPPSQHEVDDEGKMQPYDTVLGLAICRGGSALVRRLIDSGADIYMKHHCVYWRVGCHGFGRKKSPVRDVTALHLGSWYWNADGIRALLEHHTEYSQGGGAICHEVEDLISFRDSDGRLPLHWAAAGPGAAECTLPEDVICSRLLDTFRLLLAGKYAATINAQDGEGATPLYYAVGAHAACGGRHANVAIKFLLDHGADASTSDSRGQTVLHVLAYRSVDSDPIDTALLDMLVNSSNINHADKDGNTPLHIMARNLRQVRAAKFLLEQGADAHAVNTVGNTVLHEAARGIFQPRDTREGKMEDVTLADKIQAQDEMIAVLQQDSAGGSLMNQPNAAGRTARQLLADTRRKWQGRWESSRRGMPAGRGRGRALETLQFRD